MTGIEKFSNLVIPDGRVPLAAYQAIYHRITQNTEHLSSQKFGSFKIGHAEIENLHRQIEQTIQQYRVEAKSESVSFTFSDGDFESYSSFERYKIVNLLLRNGKTENISYSFDFLVILPVEIEDVPEIAQRYRMTIAISVPNKNEEEQAIHYPYEEKYLSGVMSVNIEYADRAVASNLQNLVNNWSDGLENTEKGGMDWIFNLSRTVAKHSSVGLVMSCILGAIIFDPSGYSNIFTPIRYLLSVMLLCFLFGVIGEKFDSFTRNKIRKISNKISFDFTAGDKREQEARIRKRSKAKSALIFALTGVVISAVVGIFVNAFTEYFLKF